MKSTRSYQGNLGAVHPILLHTSTEGYYLIHNKRKRIKCLLVPQQLQFTDSNVKMK